MTTPIFQSTILSGYFLYSLQIKIFSDTAVPYIRACKFLKYNADSRRFTFFY